MKQFESTRKRASEILEVVQSFYEEGRQDRSLEWIYLHYVKRRFGISRRSYYRYLKIAGWS